LIFTYFTYFLYGKNKQDWSIKLSGWSLWWPRPDREAKKDGTVKAVEEASKQKEAPKMSAQVAKTFFIEKLRKKDHPQLETKTNDTHYTPTSSMVRGKAYLLFENGIADINSLKNFESSNLEVGESKIFSGVSKSKLLMEKQQNIHPVNCEHSTPCNLDGSGNKFVSANTQE
jgi:hypothetical protein